MLKKAFGMAVVICGLAVAPALAQAPALLRRRRRLLHATAAPAPAAPATAKPAGGGQKVGQTGNPDPGVNFLNVVENPHVRVLQVTLQPGAVRRPHVHNDVTFHMLVPVTGSLELTVEKDPVVTAVPGQAYYMVKGQTHSFTNKTGSGRAGDRAVHQAGSWPRHRLRRHAAAPARRALRHAPPPAQVSERAKNEKDRAKKRAPRLTAAPFLSFFVFVLRF